MPVVKKGIAAILKDYFGLKPGQSTVQFAYELKALSPAEKLELATLAARELGVEIAEAVPTPVGA